MNADKQHLWQDVKALLNQAIGSGLNNPDVAEVLEDLLGDYKALPDAADCDLMGDPEDLLSAEEIRRRADRSVFTNEFAVAVQGPLERNIDTDRERRYISVWVARDSTSLRHPEYERVAGFSRKPDQALKLLANCAYSANNIEELIPDV